MGLGDIMTQIHRRWGKSTIYYCPKNKVVWQVDRDDKVYVHRDMPSYGLDRKELPKN